MAYTRKDYLGSRAETTLNGSINNSTTSVTITSATGWPTVSNAGFYAVIDPDTTSEEKVLVTARTGTGLTVTRGVDGTTGVSHSSGATIRPCLSATDFDEANYMVAETVGNITAAGDLLVGAGTNDLTRLAQGSASTILAVNSGGTLGYTTAATAMFADSAVTNAKLAGMTRGTVKVGNSSGVASDLALGTSGYYLKSDGTDAVWASMGEWTATLRKSSDQTISASVTDSELTFTTSNGTYYAFEMFLILSGTATTSDAYVRFRWSDTTEAGIRVSAVTTYDGNVPLLVPAYPTTGNDPNAFYQDGLNGTRAVPVRGFAIGNGLDLTVYWQKAATTAPTVKAGTYLRYRTVS